jgi:hypothetical protein
MAVCACILQRNVDKAAVVPILPGQYRNSKTSSDKATHCCVLLTCFLFPSTLSVKGTQDGCPFRVYQSGLAFSRLATHHLCSMFKASSQVADKQIHMSDNACFGGDREYPSALSLPSVDDLD